MRKALLALAFAAGFASQFVATPASADPYKWCVMYFGSHGGGATNCGFVSIEQCQLTAHGMGGFCFQNRFYTGAAQTVGSKRKRHQG